MELPYAIYPAKKMKLNEFHRKKIIIDNLELTPEDKLNIAEIHLLMKKSNDFIMKEAKKFVEEKLDSISEAIVNGVLSNSEKDVSDTFAFFGSVFYSFIKKKLEQEEDKFEQKEN